MNDNFNRFANFPRNQLDAYALRSDTVDLPYKGMVIQCDTAGNIRYQAMNGVERTRTVVAGEVLICLVKRIYNTNTTVTAITGYY